MAQCVLGKVRQFRAMHVRGRGFVIANAWSAGSARQLAQLGFAALATTSAGIAMELGVSDGEVGAEQTLAVAGAIAKSVSVPVSADLENGFAASPDGCAATIRACMDLGLAGGSIEDYTGDDDAPIYPLDQAVARIRAVAAVAHQQGRDFVLTARADNFLHGRPDLADTMARLKAFEAAGADVLFAPGLPDIETVQAVRAAINKPLNVLLQDGAPFTVQQLIAVGVERISLGARLARAAQSGITLAAREFGP